MSFLVRSTFLLHLGSTLALAGLIWFVQAVHYPLYERVGEAGFVVYEVEHVRRVGPVVIPLMLIEAVTSALFLRFRPATVPEPTAWIGLALLAVVWISTFALQVPAHQRLERGFDLETYRRLVASNWVRTWAWTARGALALWTVARAVP